MKRISVLFLSLLLVCSMMLTVSAAPFDLMPTSDSGYTVVLGDGTVERKDGALVITNNGDGDFRVTIDTKTAFDLSALPLLHMQFKTDMPFKMAYHVVCAADDTSMWPNSSDNFPDLYDVDTATDRAAKGDYDVRMNLGEFADGKLTDTSEVYFDQFIILVTGKGTFTLNVAEMTDTTTDGNGGDDEDDTTKTAETTTTVKKTESADENPYTGDVSDTVALIAVIASVGAIVLAVTLKKQRAR